MQEMIKPRTRNKIMDANLRLVQFRANNNKIKLN